MMVAGMLLLLMEKSAARLLCEISGDSRAVEGNRSREVVLRASGLAGLISSSTREGTELSVLATEELLPDSL